jgi:hypothetical protein
MRSQAMPPRVADPYPWHFSAATVCVGQASNPGLLNGSCGQVPLGSWTPNVHWTILPLPKRRTGETGPATRPPVSFVRNEPGPPESLSADIASERFILLEHPPQRQVRRKTGAPPPVRGSRLYFDWIVPGFTAVCFWAARRRWIVALVGRVRLALRPTRLSPNRCLAGLPCPSCPTEN